MKILIKIEGSRGSGKTRTVSAIIKFLSIIGRVSDVTMEESRTMGFEIHSFHFSKYTN